MTRYTAEQVQEIHNVLKRLNKSIDEFQKEYEKLINKYYDAERRFCELASLYIKSVTSQLNIKEERDEE